MKKTGFLFVLIFSSFLFQFCTNKCGGFDRSGSGSGFSFFVNAYVYNRVMYLKGHEFSYAGKDSVQYAAGDTLCFQFHCDVRFAGVGKRNSAADLMACEPAPSPVPSPLGDSLNIISLDVFNAQYPAGSDVSALFRLYNPFSPKFYPLREFKRFNTDESTLQLALIQMPVPGLKRFRLLVHNGDKAAAKVFDTPAILFY